MYVCMYVGHSNRGTAWCVGIGSHGFSIAVFRRVPGLPICFLRAQVIILQCCLSVCPLYACMYVCMYVCRFEGVVINPAVLQQEEDDAEVRCRPDRSLVT